MAWVYLRAKVGLGCNCGDHSMKPGACVELFIMTVLLCYFQLGPRVLRRSAGPVGTLCSRKRTVVRLVPVLQGRRQTRTRRVLAVVTCHGSEVLLVWCSAELRKRMLTKRALPALHSQAQQPL